jgi:hypothetical protein
MVLGAVLSRAQQTEAKTLGSEGPERKAKITVAYTTYEWWLLTWSQSQLVCQVYIEHEGMPDASEIEYYCGTRIQKDWSETSACVYSEDITSPEHCSGLYLHLASVTPGEREIEVALMPPTVYVDIANCDPQPPENRCGTLPSLHLMANEPLPNEQIINIQGYIGAESFSCSGRECTVPLYATGSSGVEAQFWAESSFGDSSEIYTAQIRVIPWGDFAAPDTQTNDNQQWYIDIISSQYLGDTGSTCSEIWSSFPPIGGSPDWLASPDQPDGLLSNKPYYYLAGNFILHGLVDGSMCPNNGLEGSGVANQCGLETSRNLVETWQNQFNVEIIRVANDTGVPARLIKNLFSRESQFWPGLSLTNQEVGFGHLSDLGADTVLLWNPSFFSQFCPLVFDTKICQRGYGNLDIQEQEILRGLLTQNVNASCPECPNGIDLTKANYSIGVFARGLLANCEQVNQIIYNTTGNKAGEVSFYEDLWKFTLVNYNAGSGCLYNAIELAAKNNYPITWEGVKIFLEPGPCQASIDYVEDIAYVPGMVQPTPLPTLQVLPTATPTALTTSQPTITPSPTPSPTPTQPGYPSPEATATNPYP